MVVYLDLKSIQREYEESQMSNSFLLEYDLESLSKAIYSLSLIHI